MTSKFKEDQAEQLRKRLEDNENNPEIGNVEVDILSLPSRKEKYKKNKQTRPPISEEIKSEEIDQKQTQTKKVRRRRVKFPLVQILLFLFLLLVILVITYPNWIERLSL